MSIENEVEELKENGLLRCLRGLLIKGDFKQFDLYLSFIENVRDTKYDDVRYYGQSYEVIRG